MRSVAPGYPRSGVPMAVLCLLAAVAACGGDAATQPSVNPARLSQVSPAVDTLSVGQTTSGEPLTVRVENSLGDPVEGVPVRFLRVSGPGELEQNLAVTRRQGIADTGFRAGSEFGTTEVRVDIPSASDVPSLRFRIVTIPAEEVEVEAREGDGQRAESGSQLPVPFRVRVATPSGTPAAGVPVRWRIAGGPEDARLSADTTYTGPQGRTQSLLTLGSEPVEHTVEAFAVGSVGTDTVRFTAAAVTSLNSGSNVDSVTPSPVVAGEEATLRGSGFGSTAGDVEVRVEGVEADVLAVGPDRIRFRLPRFADRCLPRREVGIRALVAGQASNGNFVELLPASPALDLAVGETRTRLGEGALECLQLPAADGPRTYLVTAGSVAPGGTGTLPLRLFLNVAGTDRQAAGRVSASARSLRSSRQEELRPVRPEVTLRRRAVDELRDRGFRGELERPSEPGVRPRLSAAAGASGTGDTTTLRFAVQSDLSVSCQDTSRTVTGVVRAAGDRVLLVEDTAAPDPGFTAEDWAALGREFDETILPTDSAYFGGPADIDGNGRILVVFTPKVNALTSRSAPGRIGGFFLPIDLTDSGDPEGDGLRGADGAVCPASNEGEVIYMAVADPEGRFSGAVRKDQALRNARSITAHELEHLLSAQQRLIFGDGAFDRLGAVWLQEGMAHLAEEVVGLRLMEREPGTQIEWGPIASDRRQLDLFNTFHLNNFARLSLFMQQPASAPALALSEPGGVRSLQMRGFGWALLRWVADQHGGGDETGLFRRLSRGGATQASGIENLERATGRTWEELIRDFLLTLPLDDAGVEGIDPRLQIATWDLRSIFAGLSQNESSGSSFPLPFPLAVTELPDESTAVDFEVQPSTASYFRFGTVRTSRPAALRLSGQTGTRPDPGARPRISIVRLR